MNRRRFLSLTGGAAGLGSVASVIPGAARAGLSCYPVHSAKARCQAGLSETPAIGAQPCQALTWATCLSYMLAGYGARLSEEAVLAHLNAPDACDAQTSVGATELLAAAGIWRDDLGRRFLVRTERLPDLRVGLLSLEAAQRIITRLSRQPVLCGAAGYTTLLTEVEYEDGVMTRLQMKAATVRDPWTETENLRRLSNAELARPSYLIALSVRPL